MILAARFSEIELNAPRRVRTEREAGGMEVRRPKIIDETNCRRVLSFDNDSNAASAGRKVTAMRWKSRHDGEGWDVTPIQSAQGEPRRSPAANVKDGVPERAAPHVW